MSQVKFLFQKASESIEAAELLIQQGFFDISASRSYYAMFYLAEALLFSKGLAFSSHSTVIAAFGKEFAKPKLLAPEHHRNLRDAFETRQVGDYSFETSISGEKAARVLSWAKELLADAEEYIASQDKFLE
ncbi:MAG: HEPN domain-containing protein [Anaerolineales bacterium]|nr:HEPN domain-containing protein [Anaerolineales bacterium]